MNFDNNTPPKAHGHIRPSESELNKVPGQQLKIICIIDESNLELMSLSRFIN